MEKVEIATVESELARKAGRSPGHNEGLAGPMGHKFF